MGFVSKRHENIISQEWLSVYITVDFIKFIGSWDNISSNYKPIILFFSSIKKSDVRIETFMNDSVRFMVIHKLNTMLIVPFLWMEIKFRIYFFVYLFLDLLVNVIRNLFVLILKFQVYQRFMKKVFSIWVFIVL